MTAAITQLCCTKCRQTKSADLFGQSGGKAKSWCKVCESEYHRAYRLKNRQRLLEAKRDHYLKNRAAILAQMADYREANAEKISQRKRLEYIRNREAIIRRVRAHYAANRGELIDRRRRYIAENRDAIAEYARDYRARNPDIVFSCRARRDAASKSRLAGWDSELTSFVVAEAAMLCAMRAKVTGFRWEVDHLIPLRGRSVSGLHVWNNLSVVPASFNRSKKNKFEEELMGRVWL